MCDESEIQLVLNVEVQDVGALIDITEVIVVVKSVTVERSDDILVGDYMTAELIDTASCIRCSSLQITEEESFSTAHGVAVLHTAAQGE